MKPLKLLCRTFLLILPLIDFSSNYAWSADQGVYHCVMTKYFRKFESGIENYTPEAFVMKVEGEKILFGKGGYFDDFEMDIVENNFMMLRAVDTYSFMYLYEDMFYYAFLGHVLTAVDARCTLFQE